MAKRIKIRFSQRDSKCTSWALCSTSSARWRDVAKQNDVSRIRRVTLQLGRSLRRGGGYLQDCWKWAAAKSEILPGAVLAVETIPAVTLCEDCGQQYPTVQYGRICPAAGANIRIWCGERDDDQEVEAVE